MSRTASTRASVSFGAIAQLSWKVGVRHCYVLQHTETTIDSLFVCLVLIMNTLHLLFSNTLHC